MLKMPYVCFKRIYLKNFEQLNAFKTRILLWFRVQTQTMEKYSRKFTDENIKMSYEHYKHLLLCVPTDYTPERTGYPSKDSAL